ncbi:hypothetical protein NIES4071_57700 [Calothrix sp. NIES-4071]|nr:hypothetical protein NIES4071_57700 [Calothrix sp. NIES-4071]BAZ60077.1 hypothetical protein NIES4105_57650 [Calothrix sp. NIES-4105]
MLLTQRWACGAMKLKLCYLLSACVATFGLITPPAIAFNSSTKTQEITKLELLKIEKGNIRGNDTQKNHNQQNLESTQSFSVANMHTSQSSQPNLARQLDKNIAFLVILFITYVIVSYILLEIWNKIYKKQRDPESEIEQDFIEREKEIEILERMWRMSA